MRIVTRPDFDGIVCAVLISETENIDKDIYWVEPGEIQNQSAEIMAGDILANLPFDTRCSLWFDHHISNKHKLPFQGAFEIAPSAARVVFKYYSENKKNVNNYKFLVDAADKIDAADLSRDEVCHPERHPFVLLSMTIFNRNKSDEAYWNQLIYLLRKHPLEEVLTHPDVHSKTNQVIEQNLQYRDILQKFTVTKGPVSITDLRSFDTPPVGNRFLVYSMFPNTYTSVKIRYADDDPNKIILSVGHNIFNKNSKVNVGKLLSNYNGGGHFGAGACSFHTDLSDKYIPEIINILLENRPDI